MANVSNPYEINTENNLVVTSWVDEAQDLLILRMEQSANGYTFAAANEIASNEYFNSETPLGEIIQSPKNLTVYGFGHYMSGLVGTLALVTDYEYETYLLTHNLALVDVENPVLAFKITSKDNNYVFGSQNPPAWMAIHYLEDMEDNIFEFKNLKNPENKLYNIGSFPEIYGNNIVKFKLIEYESINTNLIFSENYSNEIIRLMNSPFNEHSFWIDDLHIEYYANKCTKIDTADELIYSIRFAPINKTFSIIMTLDPYASTIEPSIFGDIYNVINENSSEIMISANKINDYNTSQDIYLNNISYNEAINEIRFSFNISTDYDTEIHFIRFIVSTLSQMNSADFDISTAILAFFGSTYTFETK